MPLVRTLLLAWACLLVPSLAQAAVLIEAKVAGEPLRIVIGLQEARVLVERNGEPAIVDFAAGTLFLGREGRAERVHRRFRPGHDEPAPYRIERFGSGPMVAGHGSTYHVLFVDDRVCAEVLVSSWMRPFVDPAVRALALLEQIEGAEAAAGDPCTRIPFTTLAAAGWPLLVGKIDRPTFETEAIRFDYVPEPGELRIPTPAAEGLPQPKPSVPG